MKRIIAGILLVLMLAQSGGAALAAVPASRDVVPLHTELAVWLANGLSELRYHFGETRLGAAFSGNLSRWEMTHAPAPTFNIRKPYVQRPPDASIGRNVVRVPLSGSPSRYSITLHPLLSNLRKGMIDPLAMQSRAITSLHRPSNFNSTNVRGATNGTTATTTKSTKIKPQFGGGAFVDPSSLTVQVGQQGYATLYMFDPPPAQVIGSNCSGIASVGVDPFGNGDGSYNVTVGGLVVGSCTAVLGSSTYSDFAPLSITVVSSPTPTPSPTPLGNGGVKVHN